MCERCYSAVIEREMERMLAYRPSPWLNSFSSSEKSSRPATPQEELVETIEKLGSQGNDLSSVKSAIDRAESKYTAEIEKSLVGVANLAKRGGAKVRRFIVAYWHDSQAQTAEGVEYPDQRKFSDSDKRSERDLVYFQTNYSVLGSSHNTMKAFRERLTERKVPFHIVYID